MSQGTSIGSKKCTSLPTVAARSFTESLKRLLFGGQPPFAHDASPSFCIWTAWCWVHPGQVVQIASVHVEVVTSLSYPSEASSLQRGMSLPPISKGTVIRHRRQLRICHPEVSTKICSFASIATYINNGFATSVDDLFLSFLDSPDVQQGATRHPQ